MPDTHGAVAAPSRRPDFTHLLPTSPDYAHQPVTHAFDWAACATPEASGEWYMVAFRSILRDDIDLLALVALDDAAHAEAEGAPGFVHYFRGPLSADRSCMSFCLWASRAEARATSGRPAHRAAVLATDAFYERYTMEFLRVTKEPGSRRFEFEAWDRAAPTV